jgi:hypothetical protein
MPFPPNGLSEKLVQGLVEFQQRNDFVTLYKSYSWGDDNYDNDFRVISGIESKLMNSDRNEGISLEDVRTVADWGRLRNLAQIKGREIVLPPRTLHEDNDTASQAIALAPLEPLLTLERNIEKGIGPTYLSKVLRFGMPMEYGAIDTRCVRVFGEGDSRAQQYHWLNLRVRNDGYGWYIPKAQRGWPSAYGVWLNILRFFSHRLSNNCPHPQAFRHSGLRSTNEWACADVEMAIFTYASQFTTRNRHK